jgi:hypothetical protein
MARRSLIGSVAADCPLVGFVQSLKRHKLYTEFGQRVTFEIVLGRVVNVWYDDGIKDEKITKPKEEK